MGKAQFANTSRSNKAQLAVAAKRIQDSLNSADSTCSIKAAEHQMKTTATAVSCLSKQDMRKI
jgi:hypothetical protein